MLQNYLRVALRQLGRYKFFSGLNVAGLSLGIASCVLILLYVQQEAQYDRFHAHAADTYRVIDGMRFGQTFQASAITPSAWGASLAENLPEVVAETRIRTLRRFNPLVRYREQQFYEFNLIATDPSFFEVFSFDLVAGTAETALDAPDDLVVTASTARKYFGDEGALGQALTLDDQTYVVSAVVADPPAASSLTFDFILPFRPSDPNRFWTHTFVRLQPGTSVGTATERLGAFLQARYGEAPYAARQSMTPTLQPLTDLHWRTDLQFDFGQQRDPIYQYTFTLLALLILVIACINFMNLATARAARRAQEVGMRKVFGARQPQLIGQFLGEAVLLAVLATALGALLVWLALPAFAAFTGKPIPPVFGAAMLAQLGALALGVGLVAGSYPALVLSRFRPLRVLKGKGSTSGGGRRMRQSLVVVQFAISIALLCATGVVYQQLDYFQGKPLGFDKEQVVVVNAQDARAQQEPLRALLTESPHIHSASFAQSLPGMTRQMASLIYQAEGSEETQIVRTFATDHAFAATLGLELVDGRDFSRAFATDSAAFLVNEAAAQVFGWADPVGRTLEEVNFGWQGEVVGVVADFHFVSLQQQIEPIVLKVTPPVWHNMLAVRVEAQAQEAALADLRAAWQTLLPDVPFGVTFLDAQFAQQHRTEAQVSRLATAFTLLAVLIACLGLFGLAAFLAEQRTKEIGVRKVLGASVPSLVYLLSKEFTKPVLIAFAGATPLAWLAMSRWLDGFAYHTTISLWLFALAGGLALLIAWLTISYQSIKAALADPVRALRYE